MSNIKGVVHVGAPAETSKNSSVSLMAAVNSSSTATTTGSGESGCGTTSSTNAEKRRAFLQHRDSDGDILNRVNLTPVISNSANSATIPATVAKKTPKDFIFGKVIGEGSFSTVYLAKDVNSNREFAIKVCDKRHILKEKKQTYIKREKEVLNILNNHPSPFFVQLYCTFQDSDRLYFVLTYAKCGELLPYINKVGSFDEECTRFYAGEIVLALEHLHGLRIIHRDLKPENILLSDKMHVLITDFGSAKILEDENKMSESSGLTRKNSFVGTAQYVSPELLTDKCASKSSDLWALGCIIYQMVSGLPPFRATNEYLIFQKITKLDYEFPEGFYPKAKLLIQQLLVIDPSQRLGMNDKDGSYDLLKAHTFFQGLEWSKLQEQTPPPIYPYLPSTPGNEELRSHYRMPSNLEPGLDDSHMTRLLGLALHEDGEGTVPPPDGRVRKISIRKTSVMNFSVDEFTERVQAQARDSPWHKFVQGNLILKQGLVDKRKGLFAKRRMLLLTTGPHLFYVDPVNLVLKGEIPWSPELRPEPKNFKTFFVHTPNRTYYLEDPDGYALEWCRVIEEVRMHDTEKYGSQRTS